MDKILFPPCEPYHEDYLQVSALHKIWYAEYGNPYGCPVIMLHGGPGAGASKFDMRYLDPNFYRIILLDQRGSKRSEPFTETEENTTQHLIADLENLRNCLNIKKWLLFGGSWGSTLAMAYGERYPEPCLGFILRGVFLASEEESQQLWYGMRDTFPEAWDDLVNFIPQEERDSFINSYYNRILHPDLNIAMPAARAFMRYDTIAAFLQITQTQLNEYLADDKMILGIARNYIHYYANKFFLEKPLIDNINIISHLPAIIVHGRYDTICRVKVAYELHKKWPCSELAIIESAGHSALEPGIMHALVLAGKKMQQLLANNS